MKLERPIKISKETFESLKKVQNSMLFSINSGKLIVLGDIIVNIQPESYSKRKGWFGKKIELVREAIWLTDIQLYGFDMDRNGWAEYIEESIHWFIQYWDFTEMRNNYLSRIKEPINQLGYEIIKKEENEIKSTEEW